MMLTRFKKSVTQPYGYLQINEFTKKKQKFDQQCIPGVSQRLGPLRKSCIFTYMQLGFSFLFNLTKIKLL